MLGACFNNIVAVIQAGGKGSRMLPLTRDKIPKPLIFLDGKPMIQWQIETVSRCGIDRFVIITGHLGDKIKCYFGDGSRFGVSINYIEEKEPLGSAGALYYLKDYPADLYLLIFGDVMFDMNLERFLEFHDSKNALITLTVHPNAHPYDSDLVVCDSDDKVCNILSKKAERTEWYANLVNGGLFLVDKKIIAEFTRAEKRDWEADVVRSYISDGVYGYRTSEYIKDVGTPERFMEAETERKLGIWERKNLSHKQRCIFLDRDGTVNKYVGLVDNPDKLELYEDTAEAVRLINESGFLTIVVTNQPVVARGMCSENDVRIIHNKMETLLGRKGAYLDDIAFCPHHPDKGYPEENPEYKIVCSCRKPKTGLIDKMAGKYNIDLSASYMVGDTTIDIQTGVNAGMHTVMLHTGEAGNDGRYDVAPDFEADNILDAVKLIIKKEG